MRVSTAFAYQTAIDAMNDRQSKLARTQTELSTGRKLLTASDDPMAAAAAERTRSAQRRIETGGLRPPARDSGDEGNWDRHFRSSLEALE